MMNIKIEGINRLQAKLDDLGKSQIPYAVKMALSDTAFQMRAEMQREMSRVLDRPMPFVVSSVIVDKSNLSKDNLAVSVRIDPAKRGAVEALAPQIFGGERRVKKSELQLRRLGVLPSDKYVAPSRVAFLDAYGNIPRSVMKDILNDLGTQGPPNPIGAKKRKGGGWCRYYVVLRGATPVGVAERYDAHNSRPVLAFVSRPSYQERRFNFYNIGEAVAYRAWKTNFRRRFKEAMATAKK